MSGPRLLVLTGPAAAGKTTLAARLADDLGWPCFGRDTFKDAAMAHLGWPDAEGHRLLGALAHAHLDTVIEELLRRRVSAIAEAPFVPAIFSPTLRRWREDHGVDVRQIVLQADPSALERRFLERAARDTPEHDLAPHLAGLRERHWTVPFEPMDVEGPVLLLDTTDPATVAYDRVLSFAST